METIALIKAFVFFCFALWALLDTIGDTISHTTSWFRQNNTRRNNARFIRRHKTVSLTS